MTTRRAPPGLDDLGLRQALSDRVLPMLVAGMAFLAALALGGVVAAAALAQRWQQGAAAALTVQVPDPGPAGDSGSAEGRAERVLDAIRATPGVAEARLLDERALQELLKPWLGEGHGPLALPLPGVVAVHLSGAPFDEDAMAARLEQAAPGTMVESQGEWVRRLALLARSLQACAAVAMGVVTFVAVMVVMVATRAGLAARRETIEIVHGLGATDGFIAGRFASRATRLAGLGAAGGAVLAWPVLMLLAALAAPFGGGQPAAAVPAAPGAAMWAAMPPVLWAGLPALPICAGLIGWMTAQATVRRWLRRLP